jgi:glutaredoxin
MIVTLYGRAGCSLCEKARRVLEHLRGEADFQVVEVDIARDPDLLARYGEHIPVVLVDGVEVARGAVALPALRRALRGP